MDWVNWLSTNLMGIIMYILILIGWGWRLENKVSHLESHSTSSSSDDKKIKEDIVEMKTKLSAIDAKVELLLKNKELK